MAAFSPRARARTAVLREKHLFGSPRCSHQPSLRQFRQCVRHLFRGSRGVTVSRALHADRVFDLFVRRRGLHHPRAGLLVVLVLGAASRTSGGRLSRALRGVPADAAAAEGSPLWAIASTRTGGAELTGPEVPEQRTHLRGRGPDVPLKAGSKVACALDRCLRTRWHSFREVTQQGLAHDALQGLPSFRERALTPGVPTRHHVALPSPTDACRAASEPGRSLQPGLRAPCRCFARAASSKLPGGLHFHAEPASPAAAPALGTVPTELLQPSVQAARCGYRPSPGWLG